MRAAPLLLATLLFLGAGIPAGCSSHTTTTTRTVERPSDTGEPGETTVTETKETTTDGPHVGVLSGTIHAIGFILALPFKIIGGLFTVIF